MSSLIWVTFSYGHGDFGSCPTSRSLHFLLLPLFAISSSSQVTTRVFHEDRFHCHRSAARGRNSDVRLSGHKGGRHCMRHHNVRQAQPVHWLARIRRRAVDAKHARRPRRRAPGTLQRPTRNRDAALDKASYWVRKPFLTASDIKLSANSPSSTEASLITAITFLT